MEPRKLHRYFFVLVISTFLTYFCFIFKVAEIAYRKDEDRILL